MGDGPPILAPTIRPTHDSSWWLIGLERATSIIEKDDIYAFGVLGWAAPPVNAAWHRLPNPVATNLPFNKDLHDQNPMVVPRGEHSGLFGCVC
jgi:hypothetical protein